MNFNKTYLLGRLTADPEIRETPGGTPVASFSVATNEIFTGKNGKQTEVEYHNVVFWGKHETKLVQDFLKKGIQVFIEGKIKTRAWTDKTGAPRQTKEIIGEKLQWQHRPSENS